MRRKSKNGHHKKHNYDDFDSNSDSDNEEDKDDFFDIDDDFDDPFDAILKKEFGFSSIEKIHNRLLGRLGKGFDQLGDEEEYEERKKKKNRGKKNTFHDFMDIDDSGPGNGTVITKTFSSRIDYTDGEPHEECYQSQSINQIKDGHTISEKQESYKNTNTGVQKAAHQRLLDDKGTKQIRKKNTITGDQEEHNIYKGIKEEELDQFNENYNNYRNKVGFRNYYKYLNSKNNKKMNYINDENKERNNKNNYPQLEDGSNIEINIRKPYRKQYAK